MAHSIKSLSEIIWKVGIISILVMPLVLFGCGAHYGKISNVHTISPEYATVQLNPDYRYYYTGRFTVPYAIIGLDKAYTLSSKMWSELEIEPEELMILASYLYLPGNSQAYSGDILDPAGKRIGVWYSRWHTTTVKMEDSNRVLVFPPNGGGEYSLLMGN